MRTFLAWSDVDRITRGQQGRTIRAVCPFCSHTRSRAGQSKKVFALKLKEPDFAVFNCVHCGESGYIHRDGVPTRTHDSIATMSAWVRRAETEPVGSGDQPRRIERALAIWNECVPISGTLAENYLANRSITIFPGAADIAFHPSCVFGEAERHPCMVALYRDIETDEPRAIHRTALTQDGLKIDRKALGPKGGCAIKLTPDSDIKKVLVVAEGIESALAGAMFGLTPIWALGDAGEIERLPVLAPIDSLSILVDNDASGTGPSKAKVCEGRWSAAGREVIRFTPKTAGHDMADIAREAAR